MENKKQGTFSVLVKPVLVLFTIAVVVSGILAYVESITTPIITANEKAAADESRKEVLAEASGFTEVDIAAVKEGTGVTEVYKADNDAGYVITSQSQGYGGQLPVMVGIDKDGKITRIKILTNEETPGLGKKVEASDYTDKYKGVAGSEVDGVSTISGATISSKAVMAAVNDAFTVYEAVKGGA